MLLCKCLQISHFGIMKMPGLIILTSEQYRDCTQLGIQGLSEMDSLSSTQISFILKWEQERLLSKLYSLKISEGEDCHGHFQLRLSPFIGTVTGW